MSPCTVGGQVPRRAGRDVVLAGAAVLAVDLDAVEVGDQRVDLLVVHRAATVDAPRRHRRERSAVDEDEAHLVLAEAVETVLSAGAFQLTAVTSPVDGSVTVYGAVAAAAVHAAVAAGAVEAAVGRRLRTAREPQPTKRRSSGLGGAGLAVGLEHPVQRQADDDDDEQQHADAAARARGACPRAPRRRSTACGWRPARSRSRAPSRADLRLTKA